MGTRIVLVTRPALTAAVTAAGLWLTGCASAGTGAGGAPAGQASATSSTTSATGMGSSAAAGEAATPPGSVPAASTPGRPSATGTELDGEDRITSSGLLPLWPFTTAAQVRQWQAAHRSGGSQPWHLDAGATALAFSSGYLRYTEIDRVTTRSIKGSDARLGVGWLVPGTASVRTVAVLHLIRVGSGSDRPWVVVGSDDSRLTIATPRYGSVVTSPLRVGGRITGVDENLRVLVLTPHATAPLYASSGIPAGGQRTPWATTVRFRAARGTVLTIAVSTGGHLRRVEAFAVTPVRAS